MSKWGRTWDTLRDFLMDFECAMDVYEFKVAWFVWKRTCFYGKEWETIPIRHFMDGVHDSNGVVVSHSVNINERTLLASLESLAAKGLIHVRKHPTKASQYRIANDDEIDDNHVLAYLRKHQPKLYEKVTKPSVRKSVLRDGRSRIFAGTATANMQEPATANMQEHNIPNTNIPISKVAAERPHSIRRLKVGGDR